MSIYDQAADKAKEQLDAISETMCYAKEDWFRSELNGGNRRKQWA